MANRFRITVTEPNGVQRTLPLSQSGLMIGRGSENNLIVNYPDVSRRHAYISFDGMQCFVTDLESGNGTFLGRTQLVPQQPTPWPPGTSLQVGGVVIHLNLEQASSPLEPIQPEQPGSRQRQETETIVGAHGPKPGGPAKRSRWTWLAILLVAALCACAALGGAGYYYWA